MEGRAIARPDFAYGLTVTLILTIPSMEGRAIARPDAGVRWLPLTAAQALQWRAGQLPGLTQGLTYDTVNGSDLQWRAGQLPGLTRSSDSSDHPSVPAFNGGPGNCPA